MLVGARSIKLKLRSKSSVQRSVAFLERYDQVMAEAKKKKDDIVTCLTETLIAILSNSSNTPQKEVMMSFFFLFAEKKKTCPDLTAFSPFQGIDYTAWNALVNKMYGNYIERAKKKPKNATLFHPLCTQLLCIADNSFFNGNWWSFLETTLLGPKYLKEKNFRGIHFDCVRPLIENYFTRTVCLASFSYRFFFFLPTSAFAE